MKSTMSDAGRRGRPSRWLLAPSRYRTAIVCGLLFIGTILLFIRTTRCEFINYDDPVYVTGNPHVQGGLSWDNLVWAFTAPVDYWHPLTWLSHMLDWQLYGRAASGHHLTSALWHAVNAVLAFLVFRRLAGGFWLSAFAAALFAWHPLRVESVAWITERKDVMSGCFFLLTLLAYARYVRCHSDGRPWWRSYLLTLACFAAGLMSKPTLVPVPLVLLILDFWPFARVSSRTGRRRVLLEKIPFFALSGAATVATVLMQRKGGAFVLDLPLGARAGNAVVSLARYLGKFFWPFDLTVCYPHPGYWPGIVVVAASVLAVGLTCFAWRQRRARPWVLAGWLWCVVLFLPVIGLVQVGFQAMADRYTYLPLFGVELALLWSLPAIIPGGGLGRALLGAVVLAACAARTWNQLGVWHDSVSLFEHAVAVSNDSDVPEDFLASAYLAANRMDEAATHAERARLLNPRNEKPLITLAGVRERQGRSREARELLRSALALRPGNAMVEAQLGLLELGGGQEAEARRLLIDALRSTPDLRAQTLQFGQIALQNRNPALARFCYDIVLTVAPDDPSAHVALGEWLIVTGNRASGLAEWRHALELDPNFPGLREQLDKQER